MKKDEFIKLGVAEDLAEKCEKASEDELKEFIPKKRFDDVNEEKKKLEDTLKERDGQLETLKKTAGSNEELKSQIETLQNENKAKDEAHKAEIRQLKVDSAVNAALVHAKAKNTVAVRALLKDIDKAELLEDGTIKGLKEQIDAIKKSEAYLFETTETTKRQVKGAEPAGAGDDPGVDVSKMTYSQMIKHLQDNPDAKI